LAPSRAATASSKLFLLGLPEREYSKPYNPSI
jgi:hypothetical protein